MSFADFRRSLLRTRDLQGRERTYAAKYVGVLLRDVLNQVKLKELEPRGYAIEVRPLPERIEGETATRRLNRALEQMVRECPGQYLWSYNRYKVPERARPS